MSHRPTARLRLAKGSSDPCSVLRRPTRAWRRLVAKEEECPFSSPPHPRQDAEPFETTFSACSQLKGNRAFRITPLIMQIACGQATSASMGYQTRGNTRHEEFEARSGDGFDLEMASRGQKFSKDVDF